MRRGFRLAGVPLVVILVVAGCSSSATPTSSFASSNQTPAAGQSGSASYKPVTLTFWTTLTVSAQSTLIQQQAQTCANQLGNITLDFQAVSQGAYPKLLAAIQAGSPPNLFNADDKAVAFGQAANGLAPVDDVISNLGASAFMPRMINAVKKDGHTWAVPDWALHQEVWYRKDLFAAKGLAVPKSWDELLADAKALDQGPTGIRGMAMPLSTVQVAAQMLYSFLYSEGVYTFDPTTGQYEFGSKLPEVQNAIQFMVDAYQEVSPPDSLTWSWTDFRTAFVHDKVAMTLDYGSVVGQAASENPSLLPDIGAFELPGPDPNTPPPAVLGGGYYYMIGKGTADQITASKALLECMYSPTYAAERALTRPIFAFPALQSAMQTSVYKDNATIKEFQSIADMIVTDELPNEYRYGMEAGLNKLAAQIDATTFVGDDLQAAATGKMTAAAAAADINKQLQSQINSGS